MMSLIDVITNENDALHGKGSSEKDISMAEELLGLMFSEEYREYLKAFTIAAINGIELTGLSKSKRVNVVLVTRNQRKLNPLIPKDWYVVEEANIDGIILWQNDTGAVFQSVPGMDIIKVADSIVEYLDR